MVEKAFVETVKKEFEINEEIIVNNLITSGKRMLT